MATNTNAPAVQGRVARGHVVEAIVAPSASRAVYVKVITERARKIATEFIEIGKCLLQAKRELEADEFKAMLEELPFESSTARRLMLIAEHPVVSDRAHVHKLPAAWGTLYELTKVPTPVLVQALEDGTITPKTERKDVARLRPIVTKVAPEKMVPTRTAEAVAVDTITNEEPPRPPIVKPCRTCQWGKPAAVREWVHGVHVGVYAAMKAIAEHPDREALGRKIMDGAKRELWQHPWDAWNLERECRFIANATVGPVTEVQPSPTPETDVYITNGIAYHVGDTVPGRGVVQSIEGGVPVLRKAVRS